MGSFSPHIVSTSVHLATPTLNLPQTSRSFEESRISPPPHTMLVSQPNLLTVTTSSNLLTVPQQSYLTKQHSHPLLSSQQPSTSGTYLIHRQHSHPELPGRTTSPSIVIEPAPLLKMEEDLEETTITATPSIASELGTSGSSSTSGGLRVKTTELRRTSSSPQVNVECVKSRSMTNICMKKVIEIVNLYIQTLIKLLQRSILTVNGLNL